MLLERLELLGPISVGLLNIRTTSANREITWFLFAPIPEISGLVLMASDRGSINIMKNRGDREHPCLQPLHTRKALEIRPFSQRVGVERVGPRPNFFNTRNKNLSTRSKAFSASRCTVLY